MELARQSCRKTSFKNGKMELIEEQKEQKCLV
jgi:hypothetical protein